MYYSRIRCEVCQIKKNREKFARKSKVCKKCKTAQNRLKRVALRKSMGLSSNYPISIVSRLKRYLERDARKNRFSNLTLKQFDFLIKQNCHYCGMTSKNGHGLDRLNNEIGYIDTNVVPCCFMCNRMKLDSSYKDFTNKIKQIAINLNMFKN